MLRIVSITLILLSFAPTKAQQYQYVFTDGWSAYRCLETGADSLIVIGLQSKNLQQDFQKHRYQFSVFNSDLDLMMSDSFNLLGMEATTITSAFSIDKIEDTIFIGGSVLTPNDSFIGLISTFNTTGTNYNNYQFKKGKQNLTHSLLISNSSYTTLGGYLNDGPDEKIKAAFYSINKNSLIISDTSFICIAYPQYGGCNLIPRQIISAAKNYLIASETYANDALYDDIQDGLIIKVDSMGNEQWRLAIENDSTTCHNLLIAPLANGNFLATWQDFFYKPFKSPTNNRYPTLNEGLTIWCAEFTSDGEVIKTWNLKKELQFKHFTPSNGGAGNHLIVTKDSSIVVVGNVPDEFHEGFSLKFDKNGKYQWYRKYHLEISPPHNSGEEKLFLNGVTELTDGGYALAGEYRSDASDSFPSGTQRGVVLFVNEYGCFEPGCQLTDAINEAQGKVNVFKVFPNPTSGVLDIGNEILDIRLKKVEIYDMQGMLVYAQSSTSNHLTSNISHLASNIYLLKIYRTDGYTEVHKIIRE